MSASSGVGGLFRTLLEHPLAKGRLSTAHKLRIARVLRRGVGAWLSLRSRDPRAIVCTRRGVTWNLDLNEGVQLALYLSLYERTTTRALAALAAPDATVIDVGANIGAQALPLAVQLGARGRVIAVEPADGAMRRLRANCHLNPTIESKVTLVHRALAAADAASAGHFYSSWPLTPGRDAHPVHQGAPERSTARACTLDSLVEELALARVDLIKLDVDGNELPVLSGALATLSRDHPVVVFEFCPYLLRERGEDPMSLPRVLLSLGYGLYDERTLRALPTDAAALLGPIPDGGGINIVAAMTPLWRRRTR